MDSKTGWRDFFGDKSFLIEFILTLICFPVITSGFLHFLEYNEHRPGAVLPDPVLRLISPMDLSYPVFGFIYMAVIIALIYFIRKPGLLVLVIQTYLVMLAARLIAMYIIPLDPPIYLIPLNDPFVAFLGSGSTLNKDLFFSGHTATLFILFLWTKSSLLKGVFLALTITVAVMLLMQHAHYSVDVFVAPFISYACYRFVRFSHGRS